jgi:hypothetical protein
MKNRNFPRHLRRQLPSAEANFEGWVVTEGPPQLKSC